MSFTLHEAKIKIHQLCLEAIENKKLLVVERLKEIEESSNTESKSSMGDKYETTREMAAIDRNNLGEQLSFLEQQERALHGIDPKHKNTSVRQGTLIKTGKNLYYISVSLGRIDLDDTSAFAISPVSPLGQALLDSEKGNAITLNGITYQIEDLT